MKHNPLSIFAKAAAALFTGGVSTQEMKRFGTMPKRPIWYQNTGNPDGYGRALMNSPRYRAYKLKRNRRARAANGGTLPSKFA